ncbi:hypothetical protein FOC1_g10012647 [Fusarium oxysporum f. sp. cubense race 1]|uniref:Uncharacterized protein n=1 Tax=Fusarium oxysporum f. sp. cubense (strain race 1) TaxID=1229664 RepID=N4TIH6_FUSC1|nr:hypothetical protein FOC1_g10012647 [Fusarium oxysporum f. sp. cubense race 1]
MSSSMNKYWIPHQDIHRKVITQELQYYLGPQATVRPYTLEGEDGFLITTPGSCLTDVGRCWFVKDFEARETICVGMLECGEAMGCWLQIAMKQKLSGAQYRYVEDEIPN